MAYSNIVVPCAFGELTVTLLKIFTITRKRVTSNDILPGMISGGIKNPA